MSGVILQSLIQNGNNPAVLRWGFSCWGGDVRLRKVASSGATRSGELEEAAAAVVQLIIVVVVAGGGFRNGNCSSCGSTGGDSIVAKASTTMTRSITTTLKGISSQQVLLRPRST